MCRCDIQPHLPLRLLWHPRGCTPMIKSDRWTPFQAQSPAPIAGPARVFRSRTSRPQSRPASQGPVPKAATHASRRGPPRRLPPIHRNPNAPSGHPLHQPLRSGTHALKPRLAWLAELLTALPSFAPPYPPPPAATATTLQRKHQPHLDFKRSRINLQLPSCKDSGFRTCTLSGLSRL